MNPLLEIFSQGEEITRGQIADTNAAWLSQQAVQLGFTVPRHTAVGDNLDDLVVLLQDIAQRADCCLCTGGLGPTSDDLTREAVAAAFDLPLVLDKVAYGQIEQYFVKRQVPMPASNNKQALLPVGAERLDNHLGTAPGFAIKHQRCWFFFMPGVPYEMRAMYLESILPILQHHFVLRPNQLVTLKTIGIGESSIQECLAPIALPETVQLGFRAEDGVEVKLLFPWDYPENERIKLVEQFAGRLGDFVFAIECPGGESGDLVTVIDKLMLRGNHTLAVLEMVSQGLLAATCIGKQWLHSASYEYSLPSLQARFDILSDDGEVVSIAKKIARQLQKIQKVDFALVQLSIEGRDSWNDPQQAITVHTLLLAGDQCQYAAHSITGTMQRKQNRAALMSLDVLRRYFL